MDTCVDDENYQVITYQIEPFEVCVIYLYPGTQKNINDYLERTFDMHKQIDNDEYLGKTLEIVKSENGARHYIIALKEEPKDENWSQTLLHEITHVIDYMIESLKLEESEIRAYLLAYLFKNLKNQVQDEDYIKYQRGDYEQEG